MVGKFKHGGGGDVDARLENVNYHQCAYEDRAVRRSSSKQSTLDDKRKGRESMENEFHI